jgi:pimeloyl-ACP methyl ester carboxylesterase
VDASRVFLFAHSMGPVTGSLMLGEEPVRGFVAVETIGTSRYEYDLERVRAQAGARVKPDEVDREVREYEPCSHRFYVEKMRLEELLKWPECGKVLAPLDAAGAPYPYMQSVADISLGKQWRGGDFPVLVIYGTGSLVTSARQSKYLVETINRWRPGRASYVEIPGMKHDFSKDGAFDEELMEKVLAWVEGLH